MRFATVASGIESPSVAWSPLGFRPVFFSEIARFPCAVLSHHYPHVPNLGDMHNFERWPDAAFDVLVGGTPCQDFSVAGFRAGFGGKRGDLTRVYLEILRRYRPRWFAWENVPGALSVDGGRGFGAFLGIVADLGYGFAWRVLNAAGFGVPQQRRRVFVIGHLGNWARAAAVLLEPESLRGNSPKSRAPRESDTRTAPVGPHISGPLLAQGSYAGGGVKPPGTTVDTIACLVFNLRGREGGAVPEVEAEQLASLRASSGGSSRSYIAFDRAQIAHPENRSRPQPGNHSPTLGRTVQPCVAFDGYPDRGEGGSTIFRETDVAASLRATDPRRTDRGTYLTTGPAVRRFTPLECERLQGFPDGYTAIPYAGRPIAADGPRYEALGNSIAVPCLRWIGERLAFVDSLP